MCRIDDCDGVYVEVALPPKHRERCTSCGVRLDFAPPGETVVMMMLDDLPLRWAWNPLTFGWFTADDWDDLFDLPDDIAWLAQEPPDNLDVLDSDGWLVDSGSEAVPPNYPIGQIDKLVNTHAVCGYCLELRGWLMTVCRGWVYDFEYEEFLEHWTEDEVIRSAAMARVVVAARRHWRRRDGSPYPLDSVADWCRAAARAAA